MSSDESKKINIIDVFLIINKNKKTTLLLPIALTLVFLFIFKFYQQSYYASSYNEASINILIKNNEYSLQKEVLESLNTQLASSENYETWSEQDQKNSLLLGQTEATSISRILNPKVENPFQKIQFVFSTNDKLNAIISFLNYTVNTLDKNLAKKKSKEIEIANLDKINLRTDLLAYDIITLNSTINEIQIENNFLQNKIQHISENNIITLNSTINEIQIENNYLQNKIIYITRYLENNSNVDSSVELNLMDTEILILKNNETISGLEKKVLEINKGLNHSPFTYDKNVENFSILTLMDTEILILRNKESILGIEKQILEKSKRLSEISSEYNKNISPNVINKKIISIGKITTIKIKPISYSLAINLMILFFVFLMITFISISFIVIKKEYDIRKENS